MKKEVEQVQLGRPPNPLAVALWVCAWSVPLFWVPAFLLARWLWERWGG